MLSLRVWVIQIVLCLLLFILGGLGLQYWIRSQFHLETLPRIYFPASECLQPKESCATRLPTGEALALKILPTPLPVLSPVAIELRLQALNASNVEIQFSNADKTLEAHHLNLALHGPGYYTGQTILPTYNQEYTLWKVMVKVSCVDSEYWAPFELVLYHNQKNYRWEHTGAS